ncbi:MAG TPA: hypothetical protein VML75_20750, partial [Kofleriaceae bacterium]|nr:hypothetical protein [Kofleriaceae bacterium]
MCRRVGVALCLLLSAASGSARADDGPPGDAEPPADDAPEVAPEEIRAAYDDHVRHRLPHKLTAVIDGAFALYDLGELRRALPELWRELRDDPTLRAMFSNLARQYRPRLDYAGYVGVVAQSTRYAGAAFGIEADLAAPLCRYLGGSFDGQLFSDREGRGLAYSTRVTGCLPWGPFAIELGFTSQQSVRMGLAAAPTSAAGRYDALGFELRIRGFRWLEERWEVVTLPTEVVFVDVAPATNDGRESARFTIDSAFLRHVRYGAGTAGEDRVIDWFPVRVVGEQDAVGAMLSATVVEFGLLRLTGARLSDGIFLDANATVQQGSIGPTVEGAEREVWMFNGGVDTAVHVVRPPYRTHLRYHRGLLPDAQFRLLSVDRADLGVNRTRGATTLGAGMFAAYTRTAGASAGVDELAGAATYGASLQYGYALYGPFYLTIRGEGARSFYADPNDLVLSRPATELRLTAGIAAAAS